MCLKANPSPLLQYSACGKLKFFSCASGRTEWYAREWPPCEWVCFLFDSILLRLFQRETSRTILAWVPLIETRASTHISTFFCFARCVMLWGRGLPPKVSGPVKMKSPVRQRHTQRGFLDGVQRQSREASIQGRCPF